MKIKHIAGRKAGTISEVSEATGQWMIDHNQAERVNDRATSASASDDDDAAKATTRKPSTKRSTRQTGE